MSLISIADFFRENASVHLYVLLSSVLIYGVLHLVTKKAKKYKWLYKAINEVQVSLLTLYVIFQLSMYKLDSVFLSMALFSLLVIARVRAYAEYISKEYGHSAARALKIIDNATIYGALIAFIILTLWLLNICGP